MTALLDLASVVRSKNAGPYELTLDIVFRDRDTYERVVASGAISKALIARLYDVPEGDVLELVAFAPASAVKITLRRSLPAGAIGDSDVYGAQQHAPLLGLVLDL